MEKCVKMYENVEKCDGDPFSIYYCRQLDLTGNFLKDQNLYIQLGRA